MKIRKYLAVIIGVMISLLLLFTLGYQFIGSVDSQKDMEKIEDKYRLAKASDKTIQVYQNNKYRDLEVRGIELSAYKPQDSNISSNTKKAEILAWLEDIKALNVNVIKIVNIQPPAFYAALNDFNKNTEDKLYTIHEVRLDEKSVLKYYDIKNSKFRKNFKKDIKNTVNVIHGKAIIVNNKRGSNGIYLNDISRFNLGYILGSNTNPELVALTDKKYVETNTYHGNYYKLNKGSPYEAFISEMFEFITTYESSKYNQISLISYGSTLENDGLTYKYESNYTSNATINLNNIESQNYDNIFIAYKYHPSDVDFLDYEYSNLSEDESTYLTHLNRLTNFYNKPLLISDVGMSSSRGRSKVDLNDGYHRGGFSEEDQGRLLVEILKYIDKSKAFGAVINSWQDVYNKKTAFNMIEDYYDAASSSFWHNVQASDESFGLVKFITDSKDKVVIDGKFNDWQNVEAIVDEEVLLKAFSDNDYLYLYVKGDTVLANLDDLYIGLDISPNSGSKHYLTKDVSFSEPVDFIVDLNKNVDSKILVNKRYNRFDYLYKYYDNIVGREIRLPKKDSSEFSKVNLLNRKRFFYPGSDEIVPSIYCETGILKEGSLDKMDLDYTSLADYKLVNDEVELRLPWTILNVINPLEMRIYDDFYEKTLESNLKVSNIGITITDKNLNKVYTSQSRYKHKSEKSIKYEYEFKDSYDLVKNYWSKK